VEVQNPYFSPTKAVAVNTADATAQQVVTSHVELFMISKTVPICQLTSVYLLSLLVLSQDGSYIAKPLDFHLNQSS